ncbi:MAG: TolC family protein, partial [Gammaproteobacteria bacterium]
MTIFRTLGVLALPLALAGCVSMPPAQVSAPLPQAWQAPLPHNGSLTDLSQWWRAQGDPLLLQLVDAAQAASPTIAAAQARLAQARAERTAAGAALLPSLDASASVSRASKQGTQPTGTTSQAGFQTAWEIDLFGGGRAARNAADERLAGSSALWHDARVAVAAEVANQYYALRACQQLLDVAMLGQRHPRLRVEDVVEAQRKPLVRGIGRKILRVRKAWIEDGQ